MALRLHYPNLNHRINSLTPSVISRRNKQTMQTGVPVSRKTFGQPPNDSPQQPTLLEPSKASVNASHKSACRERTPPRRKLLPIAKPWGFPINQMLTNLPIYRKDRS